MGSFGMLDILPRQEDNNKQLDAADNVKVEGVDVTDDVKEEVLDFKEVHSVLLFLFSSTVFHGIY